MFLSLCLFWGRPHLLKLQQRLFQPLLCLRLCLLFQGCRLRLKRRRPHRLCRQLNHLQKLLVTGVQFNAPVCSSHRFSAVASVSFEASSVRSRPVQAVNLQVCKTRIQNAVHTSYGSNYCDVILVVVILVILISVNNEKLRHQASCGLLSVYVLLSCGA